MSESLKSTTLKGVFWSGIDNVTQYGVSFGVSIVLARLLSPDDYGLIGIVAIFTAICSSFIYAGFGTALIRKKDATDEDYNTVFFVNFGTSIFLYAVTFLISPFIAVFFARPELISLTRVSALGLIIGALALVQQTILTKKIDFKTQTKITLIASILSGVIGISMALIGFGVWALVFQGLVSNAVRTIFLWLYNNWRPKFFFSSKSFQELFGFGWKMMLSGLLDTVWKQLYQVVVGKFYNPATLGQYTRAKGYSELFSSNLTSVIQRVTYPVLSNIQDEKERMVVAYRRILKLSMFISAIAMFFLGAISEPLLYCMIGPKWHEASIYLPLICISASTYPLHALNLNMLEIQGRSDLFLGLEIIKKIIGIGPFLVGAFVGIIPMLYTNLLMTFIAFLLNSHYSGKMIGYNSWMQLKDVAPSYSMAFVVGMSVYFLKYLPITNWLILPLQGVVGLFVFILVGRISQVEEYYVLLNIVRTLIKKYGKGGKL